MHKVTLSHYWGRREEIFNYLMTLSSNLVGQTGTTEPGAGWKQGSAHHNTP